MKNKGFIFTMDAVLALVPVFVVLAAVSSLSGVETVSIQRQAMVTNHMAEDSFAVLDKLGTLEEMALMFANYTKLRNESNPAWITERNNLLGFVNSTLDPIMPADMGYALDFWGIDPEGSEYIDIEFTSDNRTLTGPSNRILEVNSTGTGAAVKLVSGYEKERPIKGCAARATLTKATKTQTKVISFPLQGSGWGSTDVEIWKDFDLPSDANITNATFFVSIHMRNLNALEVNGVDVRSDLSGSFTCDGWDWRYDCDWGAWPFYTFGAANVTDVLTNGTNSVYLSMDYSTSSSFHAHLHPGMKIQVTYETTEDEDLDLTQRFYFNRIQGGTGVWQMQDFYVPQGAVIASATLNMYVSGIDDRYDIQVNGISIDNSTSPSSTYNNTINILSDVQTGTNTVAAYFDVDLDINDQFGGTTTEISNESYVEIIYTSLPKTGFGLLDLSRVIQFGGSPGNPRTINYTIPSGHDNILEAFTHIAQQRSWTTSVDAWAEGDPTTRIFDSPSARIVPTTVFIDPTILKNGSSNYVQLEDTGDPFYYILPESDAAYTFLIRDSVPFSEVFDECDGHEREVFYDTGEDGVEDGSSIVRAGQGSPYDPDVYGEDDALQRLLDVLNFYVNDSINSGLSGSEENPIDIELTDVSFESLGVGDVPFMWGPIKIRIRVWG
jgi:hypothetical protein